MTSSDSKKEYERITVFLIRHMCSFLFLTVISVEPLSAQISQCQILGSIVATEDKIDDLFADDFAPDLESIDQKNQKLARIIRDDIATQISQRFTLIYSSSIVGHEQWALLIAHSREKIIREYLSGDLPLSYQLKVSQEYLHISAELERIRGAVNCGFGFQINEDSSLTPVPIRQIEGRQQAELFGKYVSIPPLTISALLPLLIFSLLFLTIFGLLKYEAYKLNIIRRYYCDIVVTLVSCAGSHHCGMVDISRSGASFIIDSELALSDQILVLREGWTEKAHLIWRSGNVAGVKFNRTMKCIPEGFIDIKLKKRGDGPMGRAGRQ
jgi:hypothetical protein